MSDFTIEQSQPQYNPWSPLSAMGQLATQNVGVEQGQIANQGSLLNLQLQAARQKPVISMLQNLQSEEQGQGGGATSLAPAATNTSPLGTSAGGSSGVSATPLAAPGAPQSMLQNASYTTGGGGGDPSTSPGNQPSGPPPGTPSGGNADGTAALPPGPGDFSQQLYGVALPPMLASQPNADFGKLNDTRSQWLETGARQASTPQAWNSFIMSAYNGGWISSSGANKMLNNFGQRQNVLDSYASPDEQLKYTGETQGQGMMVDPATGAVVPDPNAIAAKGDIKGAEAQAQAGVDLQYKPAIAAGVAGAELPYKVQLARQQAGIDTTKADAAPRPLDPGVPTFIPPNPFTGGAPGAPGAAGPAPTAASLLAPPAPMSGAAYAQSVNGNENGTGNPAAANASGLGGTPTSSAVGNGQFINGTWLDLMQKNRPDLTAGKTQAQILAMRGIPAIASQMTQAYGQENATMLQGSGMPVNAATLGMAHMLGGDAVKVLTADPSAPLSSVLSTAVLQANPSLAKETVGQFTIGMRNKYGLSPVQFGPQAGAQGGGGNAPPAATSASPPAAPTSVPSAVAGGAPIPTNPVAGPPLPATNTGSNVQVIPNGITPGPGQVNAPAVVQPAAAVSGPAPLPNPVAPSQTYQPAVGPGSGPAAAPAASAQPAPSASVASSVAYVAPKLPIGGPPAAAVPIVTQLPGGGTSITSSMTPAAEAQQKADVAANVDYQTQLRTQASAASQANASFQELRNPQFTLGDFADEKAGLMKAYDGLAQTFGLPESDSIKTSLAGYQDYNKITQQLVRQTAGQLSPRVGIQELEAVKSSLLSPETSQGATKQIIDQMSGLNDYVIAKSGAAASYQGPPATFDAWWNANQSPTAFIVNRIAENEGPAAVSAMMARMRTQPGGVALQQQIAREYMNAQQNGLFKYALN